MPARSRFSTYFSHTVTRLLSKHLQRFVTLNEDREYLGQC